MRGRRAPSRVGDGWDERSGPHFSGVGRELWRARDDLARSPLEVVPLAGQVAGRFRTAPREGFDVSPVTWHSLASYGIALRGPARGEVHVHTDDRELRGWVLDNLNGYWRRWVERTRRGGWSTPGVPARRLTAGGVLGAPRLHYTLSTGEIATKEAGARCALDVFDPRWHALIDDAIAYWRSEPPSEQYRRYQRRRLRDTAKFVGCVIDAANRLAPT